MQQTESLSLEHAIIVNPVYENTVYINNAVGTNTEYVDAVLINDNTWQNVENFGNVKHILICIVSILCLSFILFILFVFLGGLELFLTINGGDDPA